MAGTKLLLETLRLADGGRVVCEVSAPDGSRAVSVIEASFFEEFIGGPKAEMTPQRQSRIVRENMGYLESEAERLWRQGARELVIR